MALLVFWCRLPVPATWEHQLKANTILAIGVKISLVRQGVAIKRALGSLGVVETVESESGLTKEGLSVIWSHVPVGFVDIGNWVVELALVGISSNHLKSC
jgi:hypothetical protein